MSSYKKQIQDYKPADEIHSNDAVIADQPDVPNSVTEVLGVTRKITIAQIIEFMVASSGNTELIASVVESALSEVLAEISNEATARQNSDIVLQEQIDLGHGKGGAITAYDFGTQTPSQADLIEYACQDIWAGDNGIFTYDSESPANSTYEIGDVTHLASEIFNNTWVRNTNQNTNHKWVLNNTPDTVPPVFIWADVGQDTVAGSTDTYAGIMKLFNTVEGTATDGSVTQAAINAMKEALITSISAKLSIAGGQLTGLAKAMPTPTNDSQLRNVTISTTPLTPGSSALPTGEIYICYE
jgi:hypothetical protein